MTTQAEYFQKHFPRIMSQPDPPNCKFCDNPHTQFTDVISVHEYFIPGLCQACQDDMFADDFEGDGSLMEVF